jgi:hypothetical protein
MVDKPREVRCPMCGRLNPAENDVCQYCEARLKPLTAPLGDAPSGANQPDEQDWLGDLRSKGDLSGGDEGEWEDDGEEPLDDQRDLLDWLASIDGEEAETPSPPAEQSDSEVEPAAAEAQEEVDLSAWLASLDEEQTTTPGQPEVELPDWLREYRSQEAAEPEAESAESLPDWLTGAEELPAEEEESEPDFLKDFAAEDGVEAGEVGSTATPADPEEYSGWMAEFPEAKLPSAELESEETSPEGDFELPAWLLDEEAEPEEPEQDTEIELPDWLAEFDEEGVGAGESVSPAEKPVGAEEPTVEYELPPWLLEEEPETDLAAESPKAELPDWMQAAPLEVDEVKGPPVEQFPEEQFEDLEPSQEELLLEESGEEKAGETTDDVGAVVDDEYFIPEEEAEPGDSQPGSLEETELPAPSQETAAWLSELASEVEGKPGESFLEEAPEAEALSSAFDLESFPDEELEGINLTEEPEWLAEVSQDAALQAEEQRRGFETEEGGEEDLPRAELPEWLAAMRPVDAIVTPPTPSRPSRVEIETSGPLAGLQDVLPAESQIFQISKPDARPSGLEISESQQKHIRMLEEMLNTEEQATPVSIPLPLPYPRLFRWFITLILFLAALYALWSGTSLADRPLPGLETQATYAAINRLPSGAPVLIAIDYEPGLSGEMDVIAQVLLDHLMIRGASLTFVSTTPTGPLQTENLLAEMLTRHNYQRAGQFIHLGYIPGGPAGLQTLVSFPLQLILPQTYSGYSAWDPRQTPLLGIETLNDYAAILVITDRHEAARGWIEQVGPTLVDTGLIFGSSAQVEPLIRPYYGGMVDGLVAGQAGGAAYERLTGVPGQAGRQWDVFSLLVMVSAVVIVLGGLVNLVLPDRSQSSSLGGE